MYIIVIVILLIICLCLLTFAVFFYRYSKDEAGEICRLNRNFLFMWDWMYKKRINPTKMKDILIKSGCQRVVIYGAGLLGIQVYYELTELGIDVFGFVDKNRTSVGIEGVRVFKNADGLDVDAIVVTVINNPEPIREALKQSVERVFLLDELI